MSSRRRLVIRLTIVLVFLGAISLWWSIRFAPIHVSPAEVLSIELVPIPEGPPSPRFVRNLTGEFQIPLSLIEDSIPAPLPAPKWQGFSCRFGGNVVVQLADGRTIEYGPCRRPESIERLRQRMIGVLREQ
jgi:hypothetical protein